MEDIPPLDEISSTCSSDFTSISAIEEGYSDSDSAQQGTAKDKSLAKLLGVNSHYIKAHTSRPIVVGHRGVLFEEMENTVPAFQRAADIGCDAVELDVFLLKCGTLAVFHGGGPENLGSLDDHCGIIGNIMDLTYEEAKLLPMNEHCDEFVCPKEKVTNALIPTLEEVLYVAKERELMLSLELKGPGTPIPSLLLVEEFGMIENVIFASFHMDRIAQIRELRPKRDPVNNLHIYKTAALFEDVPQDLLKITTEAGASEIHLRYDTCIKERIDSIHALGMSTLAWLKSPPLMIRDSSEWYLDIGNEDETLFQTIMNSGVKSICTNRPDVLIRHLSSLDNDGC